MDKFSIYEFLAFVLPGVVFVYVFQQTIPWDMIQGTATAPLEAGLVFFSLSLLVGLLLHRLSFFCIYKNYAWYRWALYRPMARYTKNSSVNKAFTDILALTPNKTKTIEECFDDAYWYLEVEDKIGSAKMFQSMYFYMRNLVMGYVVACPFLLLFLFLEDQPKHTVLCLVGGFLITVIIIVFMVDFYRMKMTQRILNTYVQLLKHKKRYETQ